MPAGQIDHLLNLWATTLLKSSGSPPFADHKDLYATIDSIALGNDIIAGDLETIGSTFVPIILRSDKTMVSVAMGNNEYYPLYSIGNVHNNVHCAHQDALVVIGFLAMPKTTKKHTDDPKFHKFHCQLFHSSLSRILASLRPGMSKPEIVKFGDGHFWHIIHGLRPYITDYEEQVLLACIVHFWCPRCSSHCHNLNATSVLQCHEYHEALFEVGTYGELWTEFGIVADLIPFTNDFPHTDIHETMTPDILHQVIKGTFKDHLVDWVEKYLVLTQGRTEVDCILDDIDHRIAAIASFSGLCHFLQGCGFKQWMGDDSKALMKVYILAIEGHILTDVVCTFHALLEFCYLVHRNTITECTLDEIQDAVSCFHQYHEGFKTSGVIPTFSLPQQHSLMHYAHVIRLFGTPNGLCSSITGSKHIKAVKEPWRWSSKYKALGQMLVTNQHLSKLAAVCVDFESHGILKGTCLSAELEALMSFVAIFMDYKFNAASCTETKHGCNVLALADELHLPSLPALIRRFLYEQTCPDNTLNMYDIPLAACPRYEGKISVFNSMCSRFYIPSDLSGISGMVWAFFSFNYAGTVYPCTIVHWFDVIGGLPDLEMGMWVVCPAYYANCAPTHTIIHADTIYYAAHLIPIYGNQFLPLDIMLHMSYDAF
ncbi:uncharacterized protein BJ212DRAFT_1443481 [Suillus subaureus]|uniref:CxC2-like cysteine cluster KDZ transposase-associated domain-containing protein n=1 Tax=Suillus subaureus TaxID=48587 RepID=A0A9P7EQJ9_9AGAM|nr:uncharacterized protein BJ212DRAFT_1443481 [Suillus subaureus]KAG1827440.1 hypothetical protein BJ212DRAFT_1443481 [Suillus subaureus]